MKKRTKKGFTLIELIVVIAILAILAVIAVPVVTGWVTKANTSAAAANARTLELALRASITSDGAISTIDAAYVDKALTDFGLTESQLTGGGKYDLVVTTSGTAVGAVSYSTPGSGGVITP